MPTPWTVDRLHRLTAQERGTLWENATRSDTIEARQLRELIIMSGLPIREGGGLPANHPLIERIREITESPQAIEAAKAAVQDGLPPMAGVDPILSAMLGTDYGQFDTTSWAGTYVALALRSRGFASLERSAALPSGCVAKTGTQFAAPAKPA